MDSRMKVGYQRGRRTSSGRFSDWRSCAAPLTRDFSQGGYLNPFRVKRLEALQKEDGREAAAADFVAEIEFVVPDPDRCKPIGQCGVGYAMPRHLSPEDVLRQGFPRLPIVKLHARRYHCFAHERFIRRHHPVGKMLSSSEVPSIIRFDDVELGVRSDA